MQYMKYGIILFLLVLFSCKNDSAVSPNESISRFKGAEVFTKWPESNEGYGAKPVGEDAIITGEARRADELAGIWIKNSWNKSRITIDVVDKSIGSPPNAPHIAIYYSRDSADNLLPISAPVELQADGKYELMPTLQTSWFFIGLKNHAGGVDNLGQAYDINISIEEISVIRIE